MAVKKIIITVFTVWFGFLYGFSPVFAAGPVAAGTVVTAQAPKVKNKIQLKKIRYSQSAEKTRLVFDLNDIPEYTVDMQEDSKRMTITLKNTEIAGISPVLPVNDNLAKQVIIVAGAEKSVKISIDLAYVPYYEIFRLGTPPRLVIDLWKVFEQKTEKALSDGLGYTTLRKGTLKGLLSIHILDYDLKNTKLKLEHSLAKDAISGIETVRSMAIRNNALAAVNGTYFSKTGELLGLAIKDGEILQAPIADRSAFALTYTNEILIDQVSYMGELVLEGGGETYRIQDINRERGPDGLTIYTPVYGNTTRTNAYGTEYIVIDGIIRQVCTGNSPIPASGYVISAHGLSQQALNALKEGDAVALRHQLNPDWSDVRLAVGAGPQLVKDGAIYITTKTEGFGSDVAGGRAPRTALGVDARGHLLLVTVDGRQPGHSIGMTLIELAKLMQELGAISAMNLDGGGSTEMVIDGAVVNRPSDGRERPVGDALLIVTTGEGDPRPATREP